MKQIVWVFPRPPLTWANRLFFLGCYLMVFPIFAAAIYDCARSLPH